VSESEDQLAQAAWGVGPYLGDAKSHPDYQKFDLTLLAEGDTRNVVDKYRYWKMEEIVKDLEHRPDIQSLIEWSKTAGTNGQVLPIIAIDNTPGCKQLEKTKLPKECILLFGQEGPGLSQQALDASEMVLEITQFGSTRSINASAAAAIAMHSWVMQHVFG